METNKEKKTITSLFINKIIEEFNKNENNINNNLIKPLLSKIYQNTYHYLFFIFLLLLMLLVISIVNYITLIYYFKKINSSTI
jgi:hypothetical protein